MVVGVRPVTDTVKQVADGVVGATVDRDAAGRRLLAGGAARRASSPRSEALPTLDFADLVAALEQRWRRCVRLEAPSAGPAGRRTRRRPAARGAHARLRDAARSLGQGDLEVAWRCSAPRRSRSVGVALQAGGGVGAGEAVAVGPRCRPRAASPARNACGVCTAAASRTAPVAARAGPDGHDRDRPAVRRGPRSSTALEQRGAGERAGAVVDGDDVDGAALDRRRAARAGRPTPSRGGSPARHQQHLAVAEVTGASASVTASSSPGRTTTTTRTTSARREGDAHGVGEHRRAAQRQQHLVDLGADADPDPAARTTTAAGTAAACQTGARIVFTTRNTPKRRRVGEPT